MDLIIRAETDADREAVYAVHSAAFKTASEADLVDALRIKAHPLVSLVAESSERIVGHILFSPARMSGHPELLIMGLAPMGVLPGRQRRGVGSALVRAGLEACRQLGVSVVVVLGHPAYYPRFGFLPSSRFDISSEYDVPEEVFMAIELQPNALAKKSGKVCYHEAFESLE